jgi:hypothetical protein
MAKITDQSDFFRQVRNEKPKLSQNDIPGIINLRSERHATLYGGQGINTDFKVGSPVYSAAGKLMDSGTYQVEGPIPGALTVVDSKVTVWRPVTAVVKPATTKLSAMRDKAKAEGMVDIYGNIRGGMTFSADKKDIHTNLRSTSTQLERFRLANKFAHMKCNMSLLADSTPDNQMKIVYNGEKIALGCEIAAVVKDGYDPLPNGNWLTTDKTIFTTKGGKVVELHAALPMESSIILKSEAFSQFKTYFSKMSKK